MPLSLPHMCARFWHRVAAHLVGLEQVQQEVRNYLEFDENQLVVHPEKVREALIPTINYGGKREGMSSSCKRATFEKRAPACPLPWHWRHHDGHSLPAAKRADGREHRKQPGGTRERWTQSTGKTEGASSEKRKVASAAGGTKATAAHRRTDPGRRRVIQGVHARIVCAGWSVRLHVTRKDCATGFRKNKQE